MVSWCNCCVGDGVVCVVDIGVVDVLVDVFVLGFVLFVVV